MNKKGKFRHNNGSAVIWKEEPLITLIIGIFIGASIGFIIAAIVTSGMNADEFNPKHLHSKR